MISIDLILSKYVKFPIVEVGDPSQNLCITRFRGQTFYLPSTKWQNEVSYLISKAQIVICHLSDTEGLMWEISNHIHCLDKYIFYLDYKISIPYILNQLPVRSPLKQCIEFIKKKEPSETSISFIIKNDVCYYSRNIGALLQLYNNNEFNYTMLHKFKLVEECDYAEDLHKKKISIIIRYFIKDIVRVSWSLISPYTLINEVKFLFHFLIIILHLGALIIGSGMILLIIIYLVQICTHNYDPIIFSPFLSEKESLTAIIIKIFFAISLGISFIRFGCSFIQKSIWSWKSPR